MADPVLRHRVLNTKELLMVKADPNRWLVPNMIPRCGITLLFGQEGSYKSTIIFDLCIAAGYGGKLLGLYQTAMKGPVLLNSTEGSTFDNKDRLLSHARAHNVNFAELPLHFCQRPFCMDDQLDVDELEYWLKKLQPIMVVLDPLDSFFIGDENSAKETKIVRRNVNSLIEKYNTAFVILHHAAKDKKNGMTTRGSTAWPGWADAVIATKLTRARLPGIEYPVDVVKVESKKQRNGKAGHLFSITPHIDETLKTARFTIYDGKNFAGIAMEHYKSEVYKLMRSTPEFMTAAMMCERLELRPEKVSEALTRLEQQGLAIRDRTVSRPYGTQGKMRSVPAWRPLVPQTLADLSERMVKEEQLVAETRLPGYDTLRESPDEERYTIAFERGALYAYGQNSGGLSAPGNEPGPSVQSVFN